MTALPYIDDMRDAITDPPGYVPQLSDATLTFLRDRWAPVFRKAEETYELYADRLCELRSEAAQEGRT